MLWVNHPNTSFVVRQWNTRGKTSPVYFRTKITAQPRSPSIANQRDGWPSASVRYCCHCIAPCHWLNHNLPRSPWLSPESSCSPAFWRHDRDVSKQHMVMLIFQGWLAMFKEENSTSKRSVNVIKSMAIYRGGSKDSRRVRFFLVNAIFSFITFGSPKPHFYLVIFRIYHLSTTW